MTATAPVRRAGSAAEAIRAVGAERFGHVGYPTSRDEEWRFTPVSPISATQWGEAPVAAVSPDQLARFTFGHAEWPRLVFVNGRLNPALSARGALPASVRLESLGDALERDPSLADEVSRSAALEATPFAALNAAHFSDGALVDVPASVELEHPIHLVFVTSGGTGRAATHPRVLFRVGRNARAALVESYLSLSHDETYFTNAAVDVVVGANAWVEHTRIQREAETAYHIGLTQVYQERDSHYRSFTFAMGGAITRHDLRCNLNAENVETLMYGLYFGRGQQLVDNHTAIFHNLPNCRSWEVYKGILDDRAHGVFNGKIFVKPDAQKTDAKQTNRALLLSETAKVDTKPQLEIFADDVKCTHGATVGFLNDLMLFYLRSRGIPEATAKQHLTYAFAAEVIAEVALTPVREELDRLVRERVYGA